MTDFSAGSAELSDAELIAAVRDGDIAAYALLYRRHVEAARRMTRTLVQDPADVEDLVAEAFAKLLATLEDGGGPEAAFRPYLLTTIRRLFYDRTRRTRREAVTGDPEAHDPGVPFVDTAVQGMEYAFVARAFARLPEHWQAVLWHTEVEGENPADLAPAMGLTPNGVAAMAYRARERLRQHYLQEHIAADPADDCRWSIERLGAHVRGGLSRRDGRRVDDHLDGCRRCHLLFVELAEVNAGLREVLAGALLAGSAGAYIGATGASGTAGLALFWRLAKRRSVQAAAGGAAVAAAVAALAMLLTGQPRLVAEPPPASPAPAPPLPPVATPPPPPVVSPPQSPPSTPPTSAVPSPSSAPPPASPGVATLEARLEPVGTLVRGRPGVLALTVIHSGTPGGSGGGFTIRRRIPPAVDTGPLTARLTLPRGVTVRPGTAGDGWSCAAARCGRSPLGAGGTTRAYLPVTVSDSAEDSAPRVSLTAPRARTVEATAPVGVQASGLPAVFAGTAPAALAVGGNSLLSCGGNSQTCPDAQSGRRAADNGDYHMTRYTAPQAPAGVPYGSAVSGATVPVRGKVLWAGLYWSGTGPRPNEPVARLRAPAADAFTPVTATRVDTAKGADFGDVYQASAEVTSLVRGSRGGTWWVAVAGEDFKGGFNAYAGWALIIVVEQGGPQRTVAVFDGFTPLARGGGSYTSPLWGVPGEASVGLVAWEGDRVLAGDRLSIGGAEVGGDNVAASRSDGTPAGWHTLGTDARVLPARPRSPTLAASATTDSWILGPLILLSG